MVRLCRVCSNELPIAQFYRDRNQCTPCAREYRKKLLNDRHEQLQATGQATCITCGVVKSSKEFGLRSLNRCKSCNYAYKENWSNTWWSSAIERGHALCRKCNEDKPIESFALGRGARRRMCIRCYRSEQVKKYGITVEDEERMLLENNGCCAICRQPEGSGSRTNSKYGTLSVDHCHKTNAVRGLLCGSCNTLIGIANDSPEILESAANYLRNQACA